MKIILSVLFLFFMVSCQSEPEPINYGKDNCEFCKMTIMDKKYGAELVSKKGKVLKFDDLICLVNYMKTSQTEDINYSHIVINAVNQPGQLIDFKKAIFVKSPEIRSPMLGKVAVFSIDSEAQKYLATDSLSKVISWEEVKLSLD
jgi:copper chaperone NosL